MIFTAMQPFEVEMIRDIQQYKISNNTNYITKKRGGTGKKNREKDR